MTQPGGTSLDDSTSGDAQSSSGDELPGACGDGFVEGDEACDSGVANGTPGFCAADCSGPFPYCGDGSLDPGERCDDGNTVNGDGCNCASAGTEWSWLGDEDTRVAALRAAPDGTVMAVGDHGLLEPVTSPRLWSFAADGTELELDADIIGGGQVMFEDVDVDADGRWSLFGTGTLDDLGWLYRIDGDDVSSRSYAVLGIHHGRIGPTGTAIAPIGTVAWLDQNDEVEWEHETGFVKTLFYDEDDDTVVALGSSELGIPTLHRFDLDGNLTAQFELPDYGSTVLGAVGDGYVFAGSHDGGIRTIHAYDADFEELWQYEAADVAWRHLGAIGDTTVATGSIEKDGWSQPYMLRLDEDGAVLSAFAPDAASDGMDAGSFFDADIAADGSMHLGGYLIDLHSVPGSPLLHAHVLKLVP
ncbi:MAG: DUF4215 domain-containing protein [Deltaproteobacteria bacterium]|nr:DUF4215 domain-containing protein [Nannocystaceae bacterium]